MRNSDTIFLLNFIFIKIILCDCFDISSIKFKDNCVFHTSFYISYIETETDEIENTLAKASSAGLLQTVSNNTVKCLEPIINVFEHCSVQIIFKGQKLTWKTLLNTIGVGGMKNNSNLFLQGNQG